MAWDSNRPVPWRRLVREWLIYAAIMVAVFLVFFRGGNISGAVVGIAVSGPLYLAIGFVLAKFGYQRARLTRPSAPAAASQSPTHASTTGRSKPSPTKRTGGGSRPGGTRR
jgi:hypothetical protein